MTQNTERRWPNWARSLLNLIGLIALAGIGALVGASAARLTNDTAWGLDRDLSQGELIGFLLLVPLIILSAIAMHEVGHLAGGRLVGFRFLLLIVGPLKVQRKGERIVVELNRSLGLAGGIAASVASETHNLRQRMLLMVAGGPAASLLGGLTLATLPLLSGLAGAVVFTFGVLSLILFLATLIPMRSSGFFSDGARILMLLRGGPQAARWCAAAALVSASLSVRPREFSAELIEQATALRDGSLDDIGAALMAYSAALDRGEIALAGAHLDHLIAHRENYPAAARSSLLLEAAYFTARHRGDAAAARGWLEQARGGTLAERFTWLRCEAAVLLAEGQVALARGAADTGLTLLRQAGLGSAGACEEDLLSDLRRRADATGA